MGYQFPFTYRRPQQRQPLDERMPDGRSVGEAVAGAGPDTDPDTSGWLYRPQSPTTTTQPAQPAPAPPVEQQPSPTITIDPSRYGPVGTPQGTDPGIAASMPTRVDTDQMGKPPIMIEKDRYGRPGDRAIGAESDVEGDRALLDATKAYKPTKAGWRQRIWQIVGDFMSTGARTGDPLAAVGSAIGSLGIQAAHPEFTNERWQQGRQRELEGRVKSDVAEENQQSLIEDRRDMTRSRIARDQRQTQHEKDWKANAAASQLEREYRSRPTYDPTDVGEVNDPNSLTNRAAKAGVSFGEKAPGVAGRVTDDQGYIWTYDRQGNLSPMKTDEGAHLQDTTNIQRTQLTRDRAKETERHNRFTEGVAQANLEVRKTTEARLAKGATTASPAIGEAWTQKANEYRQKAVDSKTAKNWEDYDYYSRLATHAAEQADTATAKSAGRTVSPTSAAGSGTRFRYTEADIRADNANRRAKGATTMSADDAVAKARAGGLIP